MCLFYSENYININQNTETVTRFWKTDHIVMHEINRISMFMLMQFQFQSISYTWMVIQVICE